MGCHVLGNNHFFQSPSITTASCFPPRMYRPLFFSFIYLSCFLSLNFLSVICTKLPYFIQPLFFSTCQFFFRVFHVNHRPSLTSLSLWSASAKLWKATTSFVISICLSACLSVLSPSNNSAPTGLIFVKLDTCVFSWNLILVYFRENGYLYIFVKFDTCVFSWNLILVYFREIWYLCIFVKMDTCIFSWNLILVYFREI